MFVYYLLELVSFSFRVFPLKLSLFVGRLLGRGAFILNRLNVGPGRKIDVRYNLKVILGHKLTDEEINGVVKANLENIGMSFVEVMRFPSIGKKYIDKFVEFEGEEILKKCLSRRKGSILLSGHFGNWELLAGKALCLKGYTVSLVAEETPEFGKLINKFLNTLRRGSGMRVITQAPLSFKGGVDADVIRSRTETIREVIKALRRNEAVFLLSDQNGYGGGVEVKFFEGYLNFPKGPVVIARKTGAPLVPIFIRRIRGPYHKIIIRPPVEIERTDDLDRDIRINMERVAKEYELEVIENPSGWLWNRWATESSPKSGSPKSESPIRFY